MYNIRWSCIILSSFWVLTVTVHKEDSENVNDGLSGRETIDLLVVMVSAAADSDSCVSFPVTDQKRSVTAVRDTGDGEKPDPCRGHPIGWRNNEEQHRSKGGVNLSMTDSLTALTRG